MITIKESCEVELFQLNGAVEVDGLLSADRIEIKVGHHSTVKEMGGERITVIHQSSTNFIKKVLNMFLKRNDVLEADIIEGDDIHLEATKAKLVRGNKVVIGDKCQIERVEYTGSLDVHEHAKVLGSEKL